MNTPASKTRTPVRAPVIPERRKPDAAAAAQEELKVRVRYFDATKPFATVHGDSIAEYMQNGVYFDHYGYVVHGVHAARPRLEVEEVHDKHRDAQDSLRAQAKQKAEAASKKLDAILTGESEDVPAVVEMPEDGWDEASVTKKFAHRSQDVLKLRALTNRQINGYCKQNEIEFNANNGVSAKWENIHALLTATEPEPEADADQGSKGGGDDPAD